MTCLGVFSSQCEQNHNKKTFGERKKKCTLIERKSGKFLNLVYADSADFVNTNTCGAIASAMEVALETQVNEM